MRFEYVPCDPPTERVIEIGSSLDPIEGAETTWYLGTGLAVYQRDLEADGKDRWFRGVLTK